MKPFDLRTGPNGRSGGVAGEEPEEERKHIDMGKRYGNGIQRSALSPASQLPSVVRLPPSACSSPSPSSGHTREEIALLITRRNVLFQALCNIANPWSLAITSNRLTTQNRGRVPRFATPCAIRIARGCATRKFPFSMFPYMLHKYIYVYRIYPIKTE